jgi:phage baseplate assembly protein gpV
MANGFYFGGFLNKEPSYYLELKQNGILEINAPAGIKINGDVTVSGDVVANGISLTSHVHAGCQGGTTGTPQ